MDYKYEIITEYFAIDEGSGISLQLNLIKWNDNEPKYDLRRWKDGKPLKGLSLTAASLKELCKGMLSFADRFGIYIPEYETFTSRSEKNEIGNIDILPEHPEHTDRSPKIEDAIEDGTIRNYLLRNGIKTVDELIRASEDGSIRNLKGFTKNKEKKIREVLENLANLDERICDEEVSRPMFADMNDQYSELSIYALQLFTKRRKELEKLKDSGYTKIGSLNGIPESSLERIIGKNKMELFYELERKLSNKPEIIITSLWDQEIDTRNGMAAVKRSEGQTLKEIADLEGLSRERIRQMVLNFFAGQEPFLRTIEDKLEREEDKKVALMIMFPEKIHRHLFSLWKRLFGTGDSEEIEGSGKEEKGQISLFDYLE